MSSFGRGSLAIKTAEQGSGLGLPIVKGLVDLHGGHFQLKSKPREGTEVVVIFPASRVMETLPALNLSEEADSGTNPARAAEGRPAQPEPGWSRAKSRSALTGRAGLCRRRARRHLPARRSPCRGDRRAHP